MDPSSTVQFGGFSNRHLFEEISAAAKCANAKCFILFRSSSRKEFAGDPSLVEEFQSLKGLRYESSDVEVKLSSVPVASASSAASLAASGHQSITERCSSSPRFPPFSRETLPGCHVPTSRHVGQPTPLDPSDPNYWLSSASRRDS